MFPAFVGVGETVVRIWVGISVFNAVEARAVDTVSAIGFGVVFGVGLIIISVLNVTDVGVLPDGAEVRVEIVVPLVLGISVRVVVVKAKVGRVSVMVIEVIVVVG